jgi:hypothetical protein
LHDRRGIRRLAGEELNLDRIEAGLGIRPRVDLNRAYSASLEALHPIAR